MNGHDELRAMPPEALALKVAVNGTTIRGHFSFLESVGDFSVEIDSPYRGIEAHGPHMPLIGRGHVPRNIVSGRVTEACRAKAAKVLARLFEECRVFEAHRDELRTLSREVREELRSAPSYRERIGRDELLVRRRTLRARLKAGELRQKDYKRLLGEEQLRYGLNEALRLAFLPAFRLRAKERFGIDIGYPDLRTLIAAFGCDGEA